MAAPVRFATAIQLYASVRTEPGVTALTSPYIRPNIGATVVPPTTSSTVSTTTLLGMIASEANPTATAATIAHAGSRLEPLVAPYTKPPIIDPTLHRATTTPASADAWSPSL